MILKRKFGTAISLVLLSMLVLSMVPVYGSAANTTSASVEAGDVLRYSVAEFNVDFTPLNEQPDFPFIITDHNILVGSVLYYKVLKESFNEITYAMGFILGKDASVGVKKDADWPPELDPTMLPNEIELPKGASVPFFAGEYDMDHPFPMDWDPTELPMILNPNGNWVNFQEEVIDNWHPTSANYDEDEETLTVTWQQAVASTEEGIESATLIWDKDEAGVLTQARIRGQQRVGLDISEIEIEITYGYKEHIGLPEDAANYSAKYVLSDLFMDHSGFDRIVPAETLQGIEAQIGMMEGKAIIQLDVTRVDGLFYEFEVTRFPDDSNLREPPEKGEGMAFGLGIPFLTPDWDFYTSVWATGNLLAGTYIDFVAAIKPAELPDLDIDQLLLNLKVAKEDDFRYFGFSMAETVDARDPDAGVVIHTRSNGEGWLAYEEDGYFAGLHLRMEGTVSTEGLPMEQGGDLNVEFQFRATIEREDLADEEGLPDDIELVEPEFTPPPASDELTKSPEVDGDGEAAFIPGFDVVVTVAAVVGLSVIMRRKRRA